MKKKKFLLISPQNRSVYNFRGDLIRSIQKRGYEVIVTGPDYENIDQIEELGVRFAQISVNKHGLNPLSDVRYLLALRKLMKSEKPDVTLGYTIKPVIYGAIAAKLAKVKHVNSMIPGVGYLFTSQTLKVKIVRFCTYLLYKMGLSAADAVIFQNPDDKREFIGLGLAHPQKCHLVNGSGVNMNRFTQSALPSQTTFFMLSRLIYSKGVNEYLLAASIIKKKYPDVRFMLLGAIEKMQDAISQEEANSYIKQNIIDYYAETYDVRPYMAQCSVFVLPSYYREGTPRVVLEAMAMGRPIITSDAPGCRETVIEGENGFLVPIKNVEKLAERMEWFIQNEAQIAVMGQKSYELCKRKFEVSKVNHDMMNICHI